MLKLFKLVGKWLRLLAFFEVKIMSLKDVQALANSFENCCWSDFSEVEAAKEELEKYIENGVAIRSDTLTELVNDLCRLVELQGYCYGMAIAAAKEKELRTNGNE